MELLTPYLLSRKASSAARASLLKLGSGTRYLASQSPLPTAWVNTVRIALATLPAGAAIGMMATGFPSAWVCGGCCWGRTSDLLRVEQVRYQLRQAPVEQNSQVEAWLRELVGRVGLEPTTSGLTYHFDFRRQRSQRVPCSWSGLCLYRRVSLIR